MVAATKQTKGDTDSEADENRVDGLANLNSGSATAVLCERGEGGGCGYHYGGLPGV